MKDRLHSKCPNGQQIDFSENGLKGGDSAGPEPETTARKKKSKSAPLLFIFNRFVISGEERSLQFAGLERDPEWKMKIGICDFTIFCSGFNFVNCLTTVSSLLCYYGNQS